MFDGTPEHVFLDTEVFVHFGFQYSSTALKVLAHLIKLGRLKLVITDVVIGEVEAQIDKAVRAAYNAHKEFSQKVGRVLGSSGLPAVADKVAWFDKKATVKDLHERFHKFLSDNKAKTIETGDVSVADLMADYFAGKPPFGPRRAEAGVPGRHQREGADRLPSLARSIRPSPSCDRTSDVENHSLIE